MKNGYLILFILLTGLSFPAKAALDVVSMKCEYLEDPMGIDMPDPRFYWQLSSDEEGQLQKSYRLVVASSEKLLESNQADMLDSGKKKSNQSTHVAYNGEALEPATSYFWKVKVWDKNGKEQEWSKTATFTTGLFAEVDWKGAEWISWRPQGSGPKSGGERRRLRRVALSGPYLVILGPG